MTRQMFDSVDMGAIPRTAEMVACYVGGRWINLGVAATRFVQPTVLIRISPFSSDLQLADVLDIEQGDAKPLDFHPWAVRMANAGVLRPTAYGTLGTCREVARLAPKGSVVDFWVADWTGHAHTLEIPGHHVVAVQYASPTSGSGGNFDLSTVADDTWHEFSPVHLNAHL
jgi:hypothetical protein